MNGKVLAIIPARSGSKGLKDKNIMKINGKPLIAYTIEAAQKSNIFNEIMVSTDSDDYANIAMNYGASVPYIRPKELAKDSSSTMDVILNILKYYEKIGKRFDTFMLLQPTSPLRSSEDIINAFMMLESRNANAIVSVCECEHSPLLTTNLDDKMQLDGFLSGLRCGRRQDMEKYYRLNGAIYLCKVNYYLEHKDFYYNKCYAYNMDTRSSIDIDDIYQFKFAELIMKQQYE